MEKQYSLDLGPMKSEKTSTFSVGAYSMQETPSLKLLYEDDDSLAYVHIVKEGDEEKYVIHSYSKTGFSKEQLAKARDVSALIDENFKDKGVKKLYTWATSDEEQNYAEYLGYKMTGLEVQISGWNGPAIYELSKEL